MNIISLASLSNCPPCNCTVILVQPDQEREAKEDSREEHYQEHPNNTKNIFQPFHSIYYDISTILFHPNKKMDEGQKYNFEMIVPIPITLHQKEDVQIKIY